MRMGSFDAAAVKALFAEMEAEAQGFVRTCDATAEILSEHKVYMRYAGQGWEIPVALSAAEAADPDPAVILAHFEAAYARLFGRIVDGMEAEVTVWSVNAFTRTAPAPRLSAGGRETAAPVSGSRTLFDPATGQTAAAAVVARADLVTGAALAGPAVVTEAETTVVLPASRRLATLADGCLDIRPAKENADV
jgi:N-methylhydantoinase A